MFYGALFASGPFSQLQVLLPGETNAPYTATGKIGTPNPIVGGQVICTVLATDAHWVPVPGVSDTINLNCSDPDSTSPNPAPLLNGSGQFTFSFTKTEVYRQDDIIAVDVSNGSIIPGISSQFNP